MLGFLISKDAHNPPGRHRSVLTRPQRAVLVTLAVPWYQGLLHRSRTKAVANTTSNDVARRTHPLAYWPLL